ncbi:precorrin-6y C5,15-methyltransferase (decarboxylating) subunit CbiE [Luteipulveratus sp. YIM 133132]|uniref:Precorrin-6y C5,15-methyltransferase (Decarboxylating) subunit CbiE n=1 Tax=Luteipulveratus flavus TaxID=3031728 RepID=A0ABT6C814_9MICO|nr:MULTISPECIES: precorrin-6y C5,15-methyltransferase (decarboxylating) subunit CbiE [unclassified Luteipulveratus]MDE9365231.1 precorrin-6y C5,15-methyltransferase (decarboxylating) subunit CbiE [Luteipulveratus sp. YIM 133132]MDF8264432.1 precorrin-6y C5,15-methyltransferase (decarboxylating) subunit CbiE [Luteipulveratus sp. YIM 133296]
MSTVTVVGIGADGWGGLPRNSQDIVTAAEVVVGGQRHLDLVPEVPRQVRRTWPSPLRDGLAALLAQYDGRNLVALASGDPLLSGVGTTLVELLGAERVDIVPAVSSVALAHARMGWSYESTTIVSLVGRPVDRLARHLAPGRRLIVLSADETTPAAVAALLDEHGMGEAEVVAWSRLGAPDEWRERGSAAGWSAEVATLNLLCITCPADAPSYGLTPGLPDEAFEHDGQLTKRDVRATALARLEPRPGQLLWDVGAGAGSIAIEWMRAHPTCEAVAVEASPERAQRISRNATRLGQPQLRVVTGAAPDALTDLPTPDAIFIGGGAGRDGVLDACLAALEPGGRLVAHAVTIETETLLVAAQREHGGQLTRIWIESAEPLGSMSGWRPSRAVIQWSLQR